MAEMNGYSDPINHALAFAAKHHDQQVRRGTRLPYLTAAPNIAIILTRYGQDDETVVAGILLDVVEDYAREGVPPETFDDRVGEKFGSALLESLLGVVERRYDDDGVEMAQEERREDLLLRLIDADERGRWVKAAELLHGAGTLVANLARTEFTETDFRAPIMTELGRMVDELEASAGREVGERTRRAESRKQ
jgi:(p)ppGpp synthase/HD superfamily hydrolase